MIKCRRITNTLLLTTALTFFLALPSVWSINPQKLLSQISSTDSLLLKVLYYVDEHPQKALIISNSELPKAKEENNQSRIMLIYTMIAKINYNLGIYEMALQYSDSAETIAFELNSTNILFQLARGRVNTLIQLNRAKDAFNLIDEGLKDAKKMNDLQKQMNYFLLQANVFEQFNRLDESINAIQKAIEIAEKEENKFYIAECYHSFGSLLFRSSQFNEAADWYNKAKDIREELSDTLGLIATLKNISLVNRDLGNLNDSKAILLETLNLAHAIENFMQMADVYNLLGSLSVREKKHTEALEYYNQSLIIRENEGLLASFASTLENLSRAQKDLYLFDDAIENLLKSIAIRTELKDSRGIASAYNDMGNLYSEKGDLAEALKYYLSSLKIRQENSLQTEIARSLTNIGITYRKLGSHRNALKYFDQALEMISDISDPIVKAYVLIHHGNTLLDMNDPKKALESFTLALDIRKRTNNPIIISQAYRSVASAYSHLNSFALARSSLNKAHDLLDEINDEKGIADIYNELGNLALKENDLNEALLRFQHAALLYGKYFELEKRGLTLRKIGEIQIKMGQFTNALENLKLALTLGESTGNEKLVELTLLALHDFYLARGDYKEALDYYQKHIQVQNNLRTKHQMENIWQASLDLELDKKAEEIKRIEGEVESLRTEAKLKSIELQQQKLMRNFFAMAAIFVFIIALGSGYGYFIIRQKNKWLNEANEKLSRSEENLRMLVQTKDKLFSIIAHDLRSPFTALVGLTEVLSNNVSQLEASEISEYSSLIHESSQKLLNLIENLLHWSRSQTGKIKINTQKIPLARLTKEVISILSLQADAKSIRIDNNISEDQYATADYDTLSTVIRNLLSNAIKYSRENGIIDFNAMRTNEKIFIKISDNGIGISIENQKKLFKLEESFSTKGTGQESGTGLGLIVCKEFVEKNGGQISVESQEGIGTTFTISLPV